MKDNHHFYRMVAGHKNGRHTIIIQVLMNRKNLPVKWKESKKDGSDTHYDVTFDFSGNDSSWKDPTSRYLTGGRFFGRRKEICICEFEVDNSIPFFDIYIEELGRIRAKSHDGSVHLPGFPEN